MRGEIRGEMISVGGGLTQVKFLGKRCGMGGKFIIRVRGKYIKIIPVDSFRAEVVLKVCWTEGLDCGDRVREEEWNHNVGSCRS